MIQGSDRVLVAAGFTLTLGVAAGIGSLHLRRKVVVGGWVVDLLAIAAFWAILPLTDAIGSSALR
jgi:hypothetical protein